ncbi:MAG: hypothetical protein ACT6RN_27890 [Agrobacterium sp.]|uniref:hypothetical protein n=1 Tax=Agrobacterium sp. TaxID=361 RepID=UPI004037D8BF
MLPLALIVAAISIQQGPADGLVVAKAQAQAVGATTNELENQRKFELRARSRIGPVSGNLFCFCPSFLILLAQLPLAILSSELVQDSWLFSYYFISVLPFIPRPRSHHA